MRRSLLRCTALAALAAPALGATPPEEPPSGEKPEADARIEETLTVSAPSRFVETLLAAPAAVTVIGEAELAPRNASGALAQLLAGTPGVELNDEGSGSYELNVRGFGGDLNRRVAILVDGRDVATPVSGSYEWNLFSNLSDLADVELVRGPGSALYGANAYNGVLSVVTRSAAEGGGRARFALGDPAAWRGELSWARPLGEHWSGKLAATRTESETFLRDRTAGGEYPGLPKEGIAPPRDRIDFAAASLRLDRRLRRGLLTFETGGSEATGATRVGGAGRIQTVEPDRRSWARVALDDPRGRLAAYWNDIRVPTRVRLSFGRAFSEASSNWRVEAERTQPLVSGRGRLQFGASAGGERVDSANAAGVQTNLLHAVSSDEQALFALLDLPAGERLRWTLAARWDQSSLYPGRLSPKLALVWSPDGRQAVRLTAQRAFQEPNYFELYSDLAAPVPFAGAVGPTVDLREIERAQCAPFGIDCGFAAPVRSRQRGNTGLNVEEITSAEAGYSRRIGANGWLQATYYRSRLDNFISESLPNPFGSINSTYGPYRPPAGHPDPAALLGALATTLGPLFPFLTRDLDGTPLLVTTSLTNASRVDTQGVELGARGSLGGRWFGEATYTWFDFAVVDAGFAAEIVPNAPRQSGSLRLEWRGRAVETWARWRWVEGFRWAVGVFDGKVPTFDVLTLGARSELTRRVALQLGVENALGRRYFEVFGGDLLGRRWIAALELSW